MRRRSFLTGTVAACAVTQMARGAVTPNIQLTAAPGLAPLVVPDGPATKAWLYNGMAPGPVLRARQGQTLNLTFNNNLPEPSTIHWHGLRVPVGQDGVPYFSQPPVAPGDSFTYTLPLEDAGTFWYHPHVNSSEQVGRGLNGVLVVEEPPEVAARLGADREILWAIDDWRLDDDAQIQPFGNRHDSSHGGRFGNVLTINGSYLTRTELRAGERIRLRICNVANALSFRLQFAPFDPWVIALDGHPVPPTRLGEGGLWLGAGQRADLILDVDLDPGATARVLDTSYGADQAFEVMTWSVTGEPPVRNTPLPAPEALPANPVSRPDWSAAERHSIIFEGGAMGGLQSATMGGKMMSLREIAQAGKFWAINGTVPGEMQDMQPLLTLQKGTSHIIRLENRTRWLHPIHLHGHSFELTDPRIPTLSARATRDTVLLGPNDATEIAFVADNPGMWMLHCHVLEHQSSGMMGLVKVV